MIVICVFTALITIYHDKVVEVRISFTLPILWLCISLLTVASGVTAIFRKGSRCPCRLAHTYCHLDRHFVPASIRP